MGVSGERRYYRALGFRAVLLDKVFYLIALFFGYYFSHVRKNEINFPLPASAGSNHSGPSPSFVFMPTLVPSHQGHSWGYPNLTKSPVQTPSKITILRSITRPQPSFSCPAHPRHLPSPPSNAKYPPLSGNHGRGGIPRPKQKCPAW